MDRDLDVKLNAVEKITCKEFFCELYLAEPFVASLIVDKFKQYLDDDYFDAMERQINLLRVLLNNYPLEISREIVEFAETCSLKEDYTKVILEWNYQSSEFNKQYNLAKYDGVMLAFDKKTHQAVQNEELTSGMDDVFYELADIIIAALPGEDNEDETK